MTKGRSNELMSILKLSAGSIGSIAQQTLLDETDAVVLGSVSKGIYLLTPGRRVIYISYEKYRSPLTITLVKALLHPPSVELGDKVRLNATSIDWMNGKVSLSLADAQIWSVPAAEEISEPPDVLYNRLVEIATGVAAAKGRLGFAPLLLPILGITPMDWQSAELALVWTKLKNLLDNGSKFATAGMFDQLRGLLGYGRGLTPSGDDLLTGFLLAEWRWDTGSVELARTISRAAYQNTTTLSANLIECAAAGQADERLIQVVDTIASGKMALQSCVDQLLDYGSSSGADTLAGIALAARLSL